MLTRRSLIAGFATLLAAPAIVRASSLMPVKPFADTWTARFRISGTDAYGNYMEELVNTLGGDGSPLATANAYRIVTIELLEPVRNTANIWDFYA